MSLPPNLKQLLGRARQVIVAESAAVLRASESVGQKQWENPTAQTPSPLNSNQNPNTKPLMQNSWLCRSFGRLVLGLLLVSGLGTALGKELQFAVIPKLRAPWFNRLEVGTKKAAQDLGVKTYMQAPASADEADQARLIQDAISRGVDAILVVPNNAQSLEPVFAQAKQAGIAVITHESPNQKNADFDIEMINNEKFGQAALELLAQGLGGKGDFVVYVGSFTLPPPKLWACGAFKFGKEKDPK